MPIFIPRLLAWTLGALGAAVVARVMVGEWRRVNDELHSRERMRTAPAREAIRVLRRDPQSGIYRPE